MNVGALRQHSSAIAVDREARTKIQNPKNSCGAKRRNYSFYVLYRIQPIHS